MRVLIKENDDKKELTIVKVFMALPNIMDLRLTLYRHGMGVIDAADMAQKLREAPYMCADITEDGDCWWSLREPEQL